MNMGTNIADILNFYLEAGVDEVISDEPVDQFALSAKPAPTLRQASPSIAPSPTPSAGTRIPPRPQAPVDAAPAPGINLAAEIEKAEALAASANTLSELRAKLDEFNGSPLKTMAMNTVFARGNPDARLMVIDRHPGAEEDRHGHPFAAEKGLLLSKMLGAIGLGEEDAYLAAAMPWRPPGGQPPSREDRALCLPFLKRHIELAAPQVLLLCGEAASLLLEKDKIGVNKLRGKWESVSLGGRNIPSLTIFHPAFLRDHPASKKLAWEDLISLKHHLSTITS